MHTEIDNAKDTDIVKPMYNIIEYSDIYSKPSLGANGTIANFLAANSASFKFKQKVTGQNGMAEKILK